jgi:hypothetical protein
VRVSLIAGTSGPRWLKWPPPVPFSCVVETRKICQTPAGRLSGPSKPKPHRTPPRTPSSSLREPAPMLIVPDASNRHPGYLAAHEAPDPPPYALVSPKPPQTPPWPGAPLRTEGGFALGTPPDASSIRDRAHPTTLSPTRPGFPRETLISPFPGMSVPHPVDVNSPRHKCYFRHIIPIILVAQRLRLERIGAIRSPKVTRQI